MVSIITTFCTSFSSYRSEPAVAELVTLICAAIHLNNTVAHKGRKAYSHSEGACIRDGSTMADIERQVGRPQWTLVIRLDGQR